MKLTQILLLGLLVMFMATSGTSAAGPMKFEDNGSITRPISPPPLNKEEPVKIRNCPPKLSDLPRSTGDEAGTAKGNASGTVVKTDCPPVAVEVKVPAATP